MFGKLLPLRWIYSQASDDGPGVTVGWQNQKSERLAGIEWRRKRTTWDLPGIPVSIIVPDHSDRLRV